jgi:hypothetical protein
MLAPGDTVIREHPEHGAVTGLVLEVRDNKVRVGWSRVYSNEDWVGIDEVKALPKSKEQYE